ncbi:LuxR C-terminal-related transcriptional regulator [Humibacter ginsengiterrae]
MDEYRLAGAVTSGDWDEVDHVLDEDFFFYLFEHPDLLEEVFAAAPAEWYQRHPRNVMSRAIAEAARRPVMLIDGAVLQEFGDWVGSQEHPAVRDLLGLQQPGMRALLAAGRYREAAAMTDEALRLIDSADDMEGFPDVLPSVLLRCGTAKLLVGELEQATAIYAEALRWATVRFEHPWARYAREHLAFAYALSEQYRQARELLLGLSVEPHTPGTIRFHYQEAGILALALVLVGSQTGNAEIALSRLALSASGTWWWVPIHVRAIDAVVSGTQLTAIQEIGHALASERARSDPRALAGTVLRADLATLQQSMGDLRRAHRVLNTPGLSSSWPGTRVALARQEWMQGNPAGALSLIEDDESAAGMPSAHQAEKAIVYAEAELAASGTVDDRVVELTASAVNATGALASVTQASPALRAAIAPLLNRPIAGIPVRFTPHPRPRLTRREREVLEGLADNVSIPELARKLHVSPNTVKSHLRGLYRKLGVHNREDALWLARRTM